MGSEQGKAKKKETVIVGSWQEKKEKYTMKFRLVKTIFMNGNIAYHPESDSTGAWLRTRDADIAAMKKLGEFFEG